MTQFEPNAAEEARRTLHQLRNECGCREGAVVMLSVTSATVAYLVAGPARHSTFAIAAIAVAVLLASATAGKALGLLSARARLLLRLRNLEHMCAGTDADVPAGHVVLAVTRSAVDRVRS